MSGEARGEESLSVSSTLSVVMSQSLAAFQAGDNPPMLITDTQIKWKELPPMI